jgi:hypothetical protein
MGNSVQWDMRGKSNKIVVSAMGVLLLGAIGIIGVRGQQSDRNSHRPTISTNWVGYLVAGRLDTTDQITPNPFPTVSRQVEIGLRSDGVVVWREAANGK